MDGAHARPARRAGARRRRRRVRLPRRASCRRRPDGCSASGSSGRSASRRSRAACGGATCATTRASCSASRASTRATACARGAPLASSAHAPRRRRHRAGPGRPPARAHLRRPRASPCSASTRTPSGSRRCATGGCRSRSPAPTSRSRARRGRDARALRARRRRRRRPTRSSSRSARRRSRTSRSTCRDIRSVLDELLPHLRAGHLLVLRSTVAPGTTEFVAGYLEKHRGFRVGEDIFVAHVPERIAADRFMEEIGTLPCIVGGVGEASGERAARLFEPLGAPIVQTTPGPGRAGQDLDEHPALRDVRAAEPADDGLRALRRERLRGHRPDQPRLPARRDRAARASPPAPACARTSRSPRSARNAPGMLLAVSRVNESVPLFLVEGIKRRLGDLRERKVAVLGLAFKGDTDDERDSLSHKLVRLLERELADVAVHDPLVATPTVGFDEAVRGADVVVVATNHSRVLEPRGARGDRAHGGAGLPGRRPLERFGAAQVFAYATEVAALSPAARDEPRPRHRRRRHDRRGRRAPAAARSRLGGPRLRPARGAAVDARGLRGPHRRPARARRGARRRSPAARTSSTSPRSSAGSRTSTSSRTR